MFHNLFDGHSELMVYPFDLRILYAYHPIYTDVDFSAGERKQRLQKVLFNDIKQQLVSLNLQQDININLFEEFFFKDLSSDDLARPAVLIDKLVKSYAALTRQTDKKWFVVKETSSEIFGHSLCEWFPESKFIHLVRDPRDNFAALSAGVENYYKPLGEEENEVLASMLSRGRIGMEIAEQLKWEFGTERFMSIRFEDVVQDTEAFMSEVCDFLNINYEPSLLIPTFMGNPTRGNSFEGIEMTHISPNHVGKWHDRIPEESAKIIEFHFKEQMKSYGYKPCFKEADQAKAAADFYKWWNYRYFFKDRFNANVSPWELEKQTS